MFWSARSGSAPVNRTCTDRLAHREGIAVPTVNCRPELAAANYPLIRLMNMKISEASTAARDIDTTQRPVPDYPWAAWVLTSPAYLDGVKFSAACYYFGRKVSIRN